MRAIVIREGGGPSVLTFGDAPDLKVEEGRVLVRARATIATGGKRVDRTGQGGAYIAPTILTGVTSEMAGSFGGFRESGLGREQGLVGVREYTETTVVSRPAADVSRGLDRGRSA
jgi:acyl-CoA reductase-like NAD-dependent aldehyde dehydrogenase